MRRVIATLAVLLIALPAQASDTFTIPFQAQVRGLDYPDGGVVTVVSGESPGDLVGQTCGVSLEVTNDQSLHNTNLVVTSGDSQVVLYDVESSPGTKHGEGSLTLHATIEVAVEVEGGKGGGSSLNGVVYLVCAPPTTTTTVPETTTTTVPETTTTTVPETTTTTVPETSTTTVPTTVPPTTTPSTTPSTLPFTGSYTEPVAIVSLLALAAGAGLVWMTRKADEA